MENKNYYVYGLIDPRNNQYFYIGKGKGKRYLSHLNPKKTDFNITKLERIKIIQNAGLEVKIDILFPNLDEETAFELERIVIYKLGRQIFNEGILTNLNPGGNWKLKDSVFYQKDFDTNFELGRFDFVSQQKFLELPTLSSFNYLNTSNQEQKIYRYHKNGDLKTELTLDDLFNNGVKEQDILILKALRENKLPIYTRWIYSKKYFKKLYVSDKIPFAEFDIIDQKFNRDFDKKFIENENFKMENIINGILRMEVEKNNDIISMTSYYPSGNKKSLKKTKDGRPYELNCEWYENGNLSGKIEFKDAYNEYARTFYYGSGKKHIRTSNFDGNETYESWFESGILKVELKGDAYIRYNELGNRIKVVPSSYQTSNNIALLTLDFPEYIEKIELTEEMKKDKDQADIDWHNYQNELNNSSKK